MSGLMSHDALGLKRTVWPQTVFLTVFGRASNGEPIKCVARFTLSFMISQYAVLSAISTARPQLNNVFGLATLFTLRKIIAPDRKAYYMLMRACTYHIIVRPDH